MCGDAKDFFCFPKWCWILSFQLWVFTSNPKCQNHFLQRWFDYMWFFYLSGVLVVKWVVESHTRMPTSSSLTLSLRLKDFITNCFVLFKVYIWYASWHYNIDKYLDEIIEQTHIIWILQGFSNKNHAKKMIIFLMLIPKSLYSIRTLMFSSRGFLTLMIGTLCL
jgi:hypothetical protein